MSLETLIADAVERGVLAALTKLNATPVPMPECPSGPADPVPTATAADAVATAPKKPGRSKKSEPAAEAVQTVPEPTAERSVEATAVITDMPLPLPATAPLSVTADDIEADRAKLIALTSRVKDGRKVATDLIRQHGPKFDGLAPDIRAAILAKLASKVAA